MGNDYTSYVKISDLARTMRHRFHNLSLLDHWSHKGAIRGDPSRERDKGENRKSYFEQALLGVLGGSYWVSFQARVVSMSASSGAYS